MEVKPNQIRLTLVHQYAEDRGPDKHPQDLLWLCCQNFRASHVSARQVNTLTILDPGLSM